jgi:hypothetical protein
MHFIILIPIILLFKLILWLFGITIVVATLQNIGQFLWKHKIPVFILICTLIGFIAYNVANVTSNNSQDASVSSIPIVSNPTIYNDKLAHHKKYHNSLLVVESIKLQHKSGQEVQFSITIKNKSKKAIKEFSGTLLVWNKNNKYIGDYDFDEFDAEHSNEYRDGMRWDDKNQKYNDIKDSDNWIFPSKSLSFDFGYSDESIVNYDFKNFKYLVCYLHIVFEDGTEYRDK